MITPLYTVLRHGRDPLWSVVHPDGSAQYDCLESRRIAAAIAKNLNSGQGADAWCWRDDLAERGDYMYDRLKEERVL